nr:FIG01124151: hypothetical protein [Kibdelosporangium sp. MJ126-NF4]
MPYGAEGVERQPEGISRTPTETLIQAQRLLDDGKPFHAHEVFEDAWKGADGPERALWRGLAQIAVGMTHAARGNHTGAQALIQRGVDNIWPFEVDPPYGIDITGLLRWAENPSGVPRLVSASQ